MPTCTQDWRPIGPSTETPTITRPAHATCRWSAAWGLPRAFRDRRSTFTRTTPYATRPGDDAAFNFGANPFSLQVWVNYNTETSEQTLVEKFTGQTGPGWSLTSFSNSFAFTNNFVGAGIQTAAPVTLNAWHQLVVTSGGPGNYRLYRDNVLLSTSAAAALSTSTLPLLVGRRNSLDGRDFSLDGKLDELAI